MVYSSKDEFFTSLGDALQVQAGSDAVSVLMLAQRVLDLTPLAELSAESPADMAGFMYSLWQHLLSFRGVGPRLRCFNPYQEGDGWEHRYTQVFVLQRDMPFLVDSVRMAFDRLAIGVQVIKSTVLRVRRDDAGELREILSRDQTEGQAEALMFLQIDRCADTVQLEQISSELTKTLARVAVVTDDFQPMLATLGSIMEGISGGSTTIAAEHHSECLAFLDWVRNEHFTFLGYRYFSLSDDNSPSVSSASHRRLGLFRSEPEACLPTGLSQQKLEYSAFRHSPPLLVLTRSALRSTVHRDSYCEYLVIKDLDSAGKVIGEHCFLGLYTWLVNNQSPFSIPLVSDKLKRVLARSGLSTDTHDGKTLIKTMESHPREELFHASEQQLFETLIGIWQIQERRQVRLFLRTDPYQKFISCLLYLPRDSYSTAVRQQAEALLMERLGGVESQFSTYFTESLLVRTHYVLRLQEERVHEVDVAALESDIAALTYDWCDSLRDAIDDNWGEAQGLPLWNRYRAAFPISYQQHFVPRVAVRDLALMLDLGKASPIAMSFYQPPGSGHNVMRFKVFHPGSELLLSDIVPMLENLGFLVIGEYPYRIASSDGAVVMLHEFTLQFVQDVAIDVPSVRQNFQDAFSAVWQGRIDNDSFNRLVVGARLNWRSVAVLRVYARYMKQLGLALSQDFIATTLAANLDITRNIVALFRTRFDPKLTRQEGEVTERAQRLEGKILEALDGVANLNEDQVLRAYLQLICATVRTSFFQTDAPAEELSEADGFTAKPYLAIKLMPANLSLVPEPRPEYEIFVCSPRMEGVHLRAGKVARGGIRWSERLEDYRTEILGLVKAQQVKNAVIVPTGAKGGFVVKTSAAGLSREQWHAEGVACYQLFMRALLDITDNLVDGQLVPPADLVRLDGEDAYLVVAADKGTATFSDIANAISANYHHWLGDAFASGGSNGYDHKKMAITARGAWVAVQRHLRELGIDSEREAFSAIGIGDMSGDVFGNGMLRSRQIQLVAAFNHQAIFLDPNPDPAASYAERERLFQLPRSSWTDYQPELISAGGGVFPRSLKSITLSEEAKVRFAISDDQLTPAQLIHHLLQAPVDLIWNGGIGTYVKGANESNRDVGDRANDEVRVNGGQLRCRVFGEGGNLGMTQAGRVEYALNKGACNADFIDNMGGVACSDLEVNIKIVLNDLVRKEDLTLKQRNQLLVDMTDEVAAQVLGQIDRQTLGISLAQHHADSNMAEFWGCISDWEEAGIIDRELDGLPSDEVLLERQKNHQSLVRPELAVLVSHSKMALKSQLADSERSGSGVLDDEYLSQALLEAFPATMATHYSEAIGNHPLRNEIVANQLANEIVDRMGLSFSLRLMQSTGADAGQVVRAYIIVRDTLQLNEVWAEVEALAPAVSGSRQLGLFAGLMQLGRRATRWLLRNHRNCTHTRSEIEHLGKQLKGMLDDGIASYNSQADKGASSESQVAEYLAMGLSPYAAILVDSAEDLFYAFGMADVAMRTELAIAPVTDIYARLEEVLSLNWFSGQITALPSASRWEDFAREAFVDQLETLYRSAALALLERVDDSATAADQVAAWQSSQASLFERWQVMLRALRLSQQRDYAMFSVALRELQDLVDTLTLTPPLGEICALHS